MHRSLAIAFVLGLVACTGGGDSTGSVEGTGGEGGNGSSSSSSGSSSAEGQQASGSSSSSSSGATRGPSPGTSSSSSGSVQNGPSPQCISYAAYYCGCLPASTADCKAKQAENCEDTLSLCRGRATKYMQCLQSVGCGKWSDCSSIMSDESIPCD